MIEPMITARFSGMHRLMAFALVVLAFAPALASAQQTYTVSGEGPTYVQNTSKPALYNRTLAGNPNLYQFDLATGGTVMITIAMPDTPESKQDVSAALLRRDDEENPIAVLESASSSWDTPFTDSKTGTKYLLGPSLTSALPAGSYEVRVWSSNNDATYAIMFGDRVSPRSTTSTTTAPMHKSVGADPWIVILGIILVLLLTYVARERRGRQSPDGSEAK